MKFTKGKAVEVKDCNGRLIALRVWEDAGAAVFVASEEVFRLLEADETELWPVGVPRADVRLAH